MRRHRSIFFNMVEKSVIVIHYVKVKSGIQQLMVYSFFCFYLSLGEDSLGRSGPSQNKDPDSPVKESFLGHEQESGSQNGLYNLGTNTLVQTTNAFIGNNLAESIPDRRIALFVLALDLHARLDHAKERKLSI